KRIFTAEELRAYFATTTRVGPAAHVATDEQYLTTRDAGGFGDDSIRPRTVHDGHGVAARLVGSAEKRLAKGPRRRISSAGAPSSTIELSSRTTTLRAAIASACRCVITMTVWAVRPFTPSYAANTVCSD